MSEAGADAKTTMEETTSNTSADGKLCCSSGCGNHTAEKIQMMEEKKGRYAEGREARKARATATVMAAR
jgi:hypothetical protein